MDLSAWLVRWLAGPIAMFLGVDGKTPAERRAEVIEDASLLGEEVEDLGLRHVTRSVAWLLLCGVVFAGTALVLIPVSIFATETVKDWAFNISGWLTFFPFFMFAMHGVKTLIVYYLPEKKWNPRSRIWRATMLAQTPDVLLAALMTTLTLPF
ncbi:hypothetical protein [Micromonospora deserti]|uniref:Uncharacterized protein n=1 Tax=Micromonospora deserti TaxID=2070366 RepID=A0A2W2BGC5_9ACTN|nr:hypothetical protein [Micromonospora deserti]PZF85042.1 hypothetical protein C1I99_29960 [Micromonospora deserti]